MPTTCSGRRVAAAIVVIGIAEVLVASTVCAPRQPVELGEDLVLDVDPLEHRLDHQVGLGRRAEVGGGRDPAERGVAVVGGHRLLLDHPGERPLDAGRAARRAPRSVTSRSVTSQPATAATWAIPEPIRPAPDHQHPAHDLAPRSPSGRERSQGVTPRGTLVWCSPRCRWSTGSGSDYVYIPVLSRLAVALLALVLRWIMRPGRRRGARVADPSQGLLIGVAGHHAGRGRAGAPDAGRGRAYAPRRERSRSRRQVLVWPDDVDRALTLIAEPADRADRDPDRDR